jgi:hypothetical protein
MILVAIALAASVGNMDFRPKPPQDIVIAVDRDENVTITLGGKPITCPELNRYLSSISHDTTGFDCKRLSTKPNR